MSTLLVPNRFCCIAALKRADIKEKKKNNKPPRIRFISEGKAAKPIYLSKIINLYSRHNSPDSLGILEVHDNLIRQKSLKPCGLHTQSNKARDTVPDSEFLKGFFTHRVSWWASWGVRQSPMD